MNQLITVIFDGEVFKPEISPNLTINKKYQIQLISDYNEVIENENKLDNLDQEFDWLVADLEVNMPLTRKKVYDI
ncbi:hypothetical protein ACN4EE_08465 [Geminocystis sp. CENA526]|uniref:hypothetical protein n=1 Tax=Geminocystis sp. CENA526 TaxID=1355871 RepID=UPI003D6F87F5